MPDAHASPRFETERLILRPFVPADADEVHQLLDHDPDLPGMSPEQRRTAVAYRATQLEWDEGIGSYALEERSSGSTAGYAGLQFHLLPAEPVSTPELELFFGLGAAYRGRGYAREAATLLRDHAFATLKVARLVSVTRRSNARALHLLVRLGAEIRDHPRDGDLAIAIIRASARPGAG